MTSHNQIKALGGRGELYFSTLNVTPCFSCEKNLTCIRPWDASLILIWLLLVNLLILTLWNSITMHELIRVLKILYTQSSGKYSKTTYWQTLLGCNWLGAKLRFKGVVETMLFLTSRVEGWFFMWSSGIPFYIWMCRLSHKCWILVWLVVTMALPSLIVQPLGAVFSRSIIGVPKWGCLKISSRSFYSNFINLPLMFFQTLGTTF